MFIHPFSLFMVFQTIYMYEFGVAISLAYNFYLNNGQEKIYLNLDIYYSTI